MRRILLALVSGLLLPTGPVVAEGPVDWVPSDALLTFRMDFNSIWRGPLLGDVRRLIQKGGAANALLQLQLSPRFDEIREMAGAAWMDADGGPAFLMALASAAPIDGAKAATLLLGPSARPAQGGKPETWESGDAVMALPSDKEILLGTRGAVRNALARGRGQPRADDLREGQLALRVDRNPMLDALAGTVPEPFGALAAARSARLVIDIHGREIEARLGLGFKGEKDAEKALAAVNEARKMGKAWFDKGRAEIRRELGAPGPTDISKHFGLVIGLGWINVLEKELNTIQVRRTGRDISTSLKTDIDGLKGIGVGPMEAAVAVGLLLPAVQKVREAANRMSSLNNMKQLGLALHNYHDTHGRFPPAIVTDKKGKPLYSWRVLILPYMEQEAVYRAWKLDEPWDSENNRKLSDLVIKTYCEPTESPTNKTHYRVFHGNGSIFNAAPHNDAKGTRFQDILDGTSNTLMIAQTTDAVPWAAPDEVAYDPKGPLPALGLPGHNTFLAAFADGAVRTLNKNIKPGTLHLLIQRSDGNPLPGDFDR